MVHVFLHKSVILNTSITVLAPIPRWHQHGYLEIHLQLNRCTLHYCLMSIYYSQTCLLLCVIMLLYFSKKSGFSNIVKTRTHYFVVLNMRFCVNGYLQLKLRETSARRYVHKGATDVGIVALFFSVTACVLPKMNGAVPPAMSYISFRMRFEKKRTILIFSFCFL